MQPTEYSIGDKLLFVISAKGEISWNAFKLVYDELTTINDEHELQSTFQHGLALRILDYLGHCDASFGTEEDFICISPTYFARLPLAGLPSAVVIGARSPQSIRLLRDAEAESGCVTLEVQEGKGANSPVPSRIIIHADSNEELSRFSDLLGVTYLETPPSWSVVNYSGDLKGYADKLHWQPSVGLNWPRKDFDSKELKFSPELVTDRYRLSSYANPTRGGKRLHLLWKDGVYAEVDRDWGRYLILENKRENVLRYDHHRFLFCVPVNAPLPRLLMRALTLCTGLPPTRLKGIGLSDSDGRSSEYFVFRAVPRQIALMIAEKVEQTLLSWRSESYLGEE
jgi:hypothetical protein